VSLLCKNDAVGNIWVEKKKLKSQQIIKLLFTK
jgi:hypothetical protein